LYRLAINRENREFCSFQENVRDFSQNWKKNVDREKCPSDFLIIASTGFLYHSL